MSSEYFIVNFKGSDEVFDRSFKILFFKVVKPNIVMNVCCGLIFLILKKVQCLFIIIEGLSILTFINQDSG